MLAVLAMVALPALVLRPIQDATPMVHYIQPDAIAAASTGSLSYRQIEQLMHEGFHHAHLYLGLGFGWLVMMVLGLALYWPGVKVSSRMARWPIVRLFCTLFLNKFYIDAFYDVAIAGGVKLIALIVEGFDRYIVDGLVNLAALMADRLSGVIGVVDNNRVEVAPEGMHAVRPGRLRLYVLTMFVSGTLVMLLVVGAMLFYR
jgi:hypothetical protein